MRLHELEELADVALTLALDFTSEAERGLVRAVLDDLIEPVERAAADEQDVRRVDLDELLLRVLASALRRDVCDRTLEDLQQRLLHALAGNVACDGGVLALAGYLVDLVDVNDAVLGFFHVEVRGLQQLEQDVEESENGVGDITYAVTDGADIIDVAADGKIEIKNSIFRNSLIFQGLPPIKYQNLMYFPLFLPL